MVVNVDGRRREPGPTYSGKVFIAGVGFIVTAAMWALLAYFRHTGNNIDVVAVDATLSALHLILGIAILKRLRLAWYAGLVLALSGVALTIVDGYFLPIVCDGLIALLLFFSRSEFFANDDMVGTPSGPPR